MNPIKILIVEDEVLIGLQLKMGLSRAGYTVVGPVGNGDDAIHRAQGEKPDIVILDVRLKGSMDGIEVARQIRTFSTPEIIFTTGLQDSDLEKQAMTLHPLACLVKPVDWQDLDAVIRSWREG